MAVRTGRLQTPMRKRTLLIPSSKGGVNKTTLAAHLAYEFTRYGLSVLCIDTDGLGGFSSMMSSYAADGAPSSLEVITGRARPEQAAIAVPGWTAPQDEPWERGGPAIRGGSLALIPAPFEPERRNELAREMEKAGSQEELRLAKALSSEAFSSVDVIIVDMPGTASPTIINSMFYAAANIVYPAAPEYLALQGIQAVDAQIAGWVENASGDNTYIATLGAIPTSIDGPQAMKKHTPRRDVLEATEKWLTSVEGVDMHLLAPGIELRSAMVRAGNDCIPIQRMTATQTELRDAATIPPAFARIALSVLQEMNDANDEELFPTEAMEKALEKQAKKLQIKPKELRDKWKTAMSSPRYMKLVDNNE